MEADPSLSYVTVRTPGQQDTVPLSGLGVLDTSSTAFLAGMVDATQTLDLSDDWVGWRLWFGAAIDFNYNAGSFGVPASQGYLIKGRGQKNSEWANATFQPTANAHGHFDSSTGTWELDYYDTFPGGWVELHLEGPYYATSAP
jgi:hypothetical protein